MSKRLGILGGTFDPIHYGHLRLAEEAREEFSLERVIFVPARTSPLKLDVEAAPAEERARMVEAAIAGNPVFEMSRMEIDREGPSYTVDTLRALKALYPRHELFFLTGADAAADLPKWREPETILFLATFVASERPGLGLAELQEILPPAYLSKLETLDMLPVDISGTRLRERLSYGHSIRYLTPDAVVEHIAQRNLYRAAAELKFEE